MLPALLWYDCSQTGLALALLIPVQPSAQVCSAPLGAWCLELLSALLSAQTLIWIKSVLLLLKGRKRRFLGERKAKQTQTQTKAQELSASVLTRDQQAQSGPQMPDGLDLGSTLGLGSLLAGPAGHCAPARLPCVPLRT